MNCAWEPLMAVLPHRMRLQLDHQTKQKLQEIRLRLHQPVELIAAGYSKFIDLKTNEDDLKFVINAASRYSPWAAATVAQGYLTINGGHRIGLCGDCVVQGGKVSALREITSLCMRVARSISGIAEKAPRTGSVLILGPPGSGKTTLLRDIIRIRSVSGQAVAVVDERGELFPSSGVFDAGPRSDILTGCTKRQGVHMTLKTMGPDCIAVDEITSEEDCQALLSAGWCGVELLATAHASNCEDLYRRQIYQPLIRCGLFQQILVLDKSKKWRMERINGCTQKSLAQY